MSYDEDGEGYRPGFDPRDRTPTINIGDELKIKVEGVGKNGDPYGRHNGFVIFIKGVGTPIPAGTSKIVKVTKVGSTFALGQLAGDKSVA